MKSLAWMYFWSFVTGLALWAFTMAVVVNLGGCGVRVHAQTVEVHASATPVPTPTADDITLAYKRGWMEYCADSFAVDEFHRQADALPDDQDQTELERIWSDCKKQAAQMERQWNDLTREQKLSYPIRSFWKSGRGMPRRISKAARHEMIDKLSPYKGS